MEEGDPSWRAGQRWSDALVRPSREPQRRLTCRFVSPLSRTGQTMLLSFGDLLNGTPEVWDDSTLR